jgi:hypothetical protein
MMLVMLVLVLALGLGFLAGRSLLRRPWSTVPTAYWHGGPSLEQIQTLSSLVTMRVEVADVQQTQIAGHTGSVKAAVLVKGDYLLGVDLSRAKLEGVDPATQTAVLVLPEPQVQSPRVDHVRTRVFAITHDGLWLLVPGDAGRTEVINLAFVDAQRCVEMAAADPALMQRCRDQTRQVLTTFCRGFGWTVEVRWGS